MKIAGLAPRKQGQRYNREMLIEMLRDFNSRYGREPLSKDLDINLPTARTFRRYFGTWADAKEIALGGQNE